MTSSYQPQSLAPQFQPREIASAAEPARQNAESLQRQLDTFQGQLAQRAQNRLEDQQYYGKELEAFSQFSKKALDITTKIFKQSAKDKEIGAQYATLYQLNVPIDAETQLLIDAEIEQGTYGAAARQAESAGYYAEADAARAQMRLANGVQNERALLLDARSKYSAEMTRLLNGPLAERYNDDPGSAIDQANRIFIEKYGLQYTTKANFVEIMGDTMRNQSSMFGVNKENQLAAERRENNLLESDQLIIQNVSGLSYENVGGRFQQLADKILKEDNGINTQKGANARVARLWLNTAASTGREDLLNIVGATLVIPDNTGTSIASTYAGLFYEATIAVQQAKQDNMLRLRAQVLMEAGQAIQGTTGEERRQILLQQSERLAGDIEGQRRLQQQFGGYNDSPETFANEDRLSQQIAEQPGSVSPQMIQNSVQTGELTPEGGARLQTQLSARVKPITEQIANVRAVGNSRFREQLKLQSGATDDPNGGFIVGSKSKISKDQLTAINTAYKADLNLVLDAYKYTLDPSLSPAEIQEKLSAKANEFFEKETSAGGRYYFNGLFDGEPLQRKELKNKQDFQSIIDAVKAWNGGVPLKRNTSGGATDWSNQWSPNQGGKALARVYKPGDIIFTKEEVEERLNNPAGSIYNPQLAILARQLKRTPRQLLRDSGAPVGIQVGEFTTQQVGELLAERKNDTSDNPVRDKPGVGGNYDETVARLIPAYMSYGLTLDGAAVAASVFRFQSAQYAGKNDGADITKDNPNGFMKMSTNALINAGVFEDLKNPRLTLKQIVYKLSKTDAGYKLNWLDYAEFYKQRFLSEYNKT